MGLSAVALPQFTKFLITTGDKLPFTSRGSSDEECELSRAADDTHLILGAQPYSTHHHGGHEKDAARVCLGAQLAANPSIVVM